MSSSVGQTIQNECKLVIVVDFYPCHDHSIPPEGIKLVQIINF